MSETDANSDTAIYHMCRRDEWQAAQASGAYGGSSQDVADGFIHFSAADQLRETAAKHFHGQADLLLIAVETGQMPLSVALYITRAEEKDVQKALEAAYASGELRGKKLLRIGMRGLGQNRLRRAFLHQLRPLLPHLPRS